MPLIERAHVSDRSPRFQTAQMEVVVAWGPHDLPGDCAVSFVNNIFKHANQPQVEVAYCADLFAVVVFTRLHLFEDDPICIDEFIPKALKAEKRPVVFLEFHEYKSNHNHRKTNQMY